MATTVICTSSPIRIVSPSRRDRTSMVPSTNRAPLPTNGATRSENDITRERDSSQTWGRTAPVAAHDVTKRDKKTPPARILLTAGPFVTGAFLANKTRERILQ